MPIMVDEGSGSSIPPHPEGQYAATCIDVIDRGLVQTTWQGVTKEKHKITLRFYCGEQAPTHDENGNEVMMPLWVDAWFTATLHENGSLRPFLERWRGKKFTAQELKGFDVEKLMGVGAYLQISHNETATKTYANIDAAIKLPAGTEAPRLASYVRVKDRPPKDDEGNAPAGVGAGTPFDEGDDLPF